MALKPYAHFADRDPLTRVVLEQMLAGVSPRRLSRTREPVGEDVLAAERSTSKSAVSREFVGRTREHLDARPGGGASLGAQGANVIEHLPERDRPPLKARLRKAQATENPQLALDGLRLLADELDRPYPGAAASLREGMEETLTRSPASGSADASGQRCRAPTRSSR